MRTTSAPKPGDFFTMSPRTESALRLRRIGWLALLLLPFCVRAELKVGETFPALAPAGVVALLGDTLPAIEGKVVLFDFWASWCAPCKASFPALAKLHTDYAARGFMVVAISVDEKSAAASAFAKRMAPPFSTLHDREQKLVRQVVVPTMPTSYLIGRDGKVRAVHEGFRGDATVSALRREIEALLVSENPHP